MLEKQYQISGHPNYTLQGMDVFKNGVNPIKRVLKNNVAGWYIDRKFISRNSIKLLVQQSTAINNENKKTKTTML